MASTIEVALKGPCTAVQIAAFYDALRRALKAAPDPAEIHITVAGLIAGDESEPPHRGRAATVSRLPDWRDAR